MKAVKIEAGKRLLAPSARSGVPPFMVMDVMAAAARIEEQGARVIHMEVGQPAAPAPSSAIAAAQAALRKGRIGYTEALGIPSLRARISRHYAESYGAEIDPARIVITTGSSGGFILAFLALFEPGDRVAVAEPGYPPYRHILTALGCEPVPIPISAETRWALTVEGVMEAHRKRPLRGVLAASPANPTGTMLDAAHLSALERACDDAGIRFVSDEIYHGLDYAFPAETAAKISPDVLVVNSFSKYFCMTGWRIGWLVVPEALARRSSACSRISRSPCRRSRRSRRRRRSTGARRWRRSSAATRRTARSSSTACRRRDSTDSCPSTARSISMPMSRASPTTASALRS
jgi:aspartate/methionine/tyrosine aminotransferase